MLSNGIYHFCLYRWNHKFEITLSNEEGIHANAIKAQNNGTLPQRTKISTTAVVPTVIFKLKFYLIFWTKKRYQILCQKTAEDISIRKRAKKIGI